MPDAHSTRSSFSRSGRDIALGDLPADQVIEIERAGRIVIRATAGELIREARLPHFLTLDQVEFAFSGQDEPGLPAFT